MTNRDTFEVLRDFVDLYELCANFVDNNQISDPKEIYEKRVVDNALDFIQSVCEMVGYYEADGKNNH